MSCHYPLISLTEVRRCITVHFSYGPYKMASMYVARERGVTADTLSQDEYCLDKHKLQEFAWRCCGQQCSFQSSENG